MFLDNIKKFLLTLAFVSLGCQFAFSDKELYPLTEQPKLSASAAEAVYDENDDPMVQLDIYTNVPDLSFKGSSVMNQAKKDFGYTVFLLDGAKEIEVGAEEGFLPIKLTFSPALKGGNRYTQSLATRDIKRRLTFSWVDSTPMRVYIDNEDIGVTPFDELLVTGPHTIVIKQPGLDISVLEYPVIITREQDTNLGVLKPEQNKEVFVEVKTDPNALILIDRQLPKKTYGGFLVPQGTHDIISIQPFKFTRGNGSSYYEEILGNMKRKNFSSNKSSVDLPLAGQLTLHKASTNFPNLVTKIVPKRSKYTLQNGTMLPPQEGAYYGTYIIDKPIYPLMGEYEILMSAQGYRDKTATIFIEPGEEATYTIKLDRARPYTFVMYNMSINNYVGLEIGGCGKYFGWYGRFAGIGAYDSYDVDTDSYGNTESSGHISFTAATGPMFTILRTRTWLYLEIGGGYMQKFYDDEMKDLDDPMKGWLAEAALVARTPKGFSFKIGYSYPFLDDDEYSLNIQNFQISIGYAF